MLSGVTGFEGDTKGLDGVLTSGLTAPGGIEPCGRSPRLFRAMALIYPQSRQVLNDILNGGHNPFSTGRAGCSDTGGESLLGTISIPSLRPTPRVKARVKGENQAIVTPAPPSKVPDLRPAPPPAWRPNG
jgi:hypothetical protein